MKESVMREIVRTAMLLRSSKRLFSKEKKAEKELKKMAKRPRAYQFKKAGRLCSQVRESNTHGLHHFVLSSKTGSGKKQILYLHGGAFARQPSFLQWRFADKLVERTHASLAFVVYPKTPLHTHDETFEKLLLLYRDMLQSADGEEIIFVGDSAGANIALAFSVWLQGQGLAPPAKVICFSPCVDLQLNNPGITKKLRKKDPILGVDGLLVFIKAWAGGAPLNHPLISPLYADLSLLPPTTVFIGSDEILLPDVRLFKKLARECGVEIELHVYEKLYHCFFLFPLKEAKEAVDRTVKLIAES
jgi:acetyl esterase/lipase